LAKGSTILKKDRTIILAKGMRELIRLGRKEIENITTRENKREREREREKDKSLKLHHVSGNDTH
jgi:hypothetical protein